MPSNDSTQQLEISYSPRRRRMVAFLATLSALFAVAGVLASRTLPDDSGTYDTPPTQTPRNLVTDGLGTPIAIETQAPTQRPPTGSAVVTSDTRTDPSPAGSTPTPTPAPPSAPSFTCDTWSAVIQPGGVERIGCRLYPAEFPGRVSMLCGEDPQGQDCRAEPDAFDLRGKRAPIRFELVVTTLYQTPPSSYTETIRMAGGSGQKRLFTVHVPAVVGTVSIDCPSPVIVALAGDQTVTCEITSQDGFDGNVMLQGFQAFDGGNARILVVDPVRVPPGETVSVDLTLRSSAVPLVPVLMDIDVLPEGYASDTFSFLIAPGV